MFKNAPAQCPPDELIAVTVRFVTPHFKIREETLHRLFESDVMCSKFISLKIILEIGRREAMPVDHHSFTFNTARKASCGISTRPTRFMRFLPSFCFSRSLRLREMSPP